MKYRIGSFCHCGFPDECFDHWQVETDDNPVDSSVQTIIADDLTRESAELIVNALNQPEYEPFAMRVGEGKICRYHETDWMVPRELLLYRKVERA